MESLSPLHWPIWQKIVFRILFIYFVLFASSLIGFFEIIPGVSFLNQYWNLFETWLVQTCNTYLWKIQPEVAPVFNGSGDTSFSWALLYTYLFVALVGGIIWTILDRKRPHYATLDFWLRNLVRYTASLWAFYYGIIKLFGLQMPFPNLSQLATPLGDFLPMRLSWMFIGYSFQYQFFSGLMEVLVGLFLFYRKTVTLGALMGIAVFANVVMLNLSYDIPVKIFSIELLACCLFLGARDLKRIAQFFLLNQATHPDFSYQLDLNKRWQKIARIVAKVAFLVLFVGLPFYQSWTRYATQFEVMVQKPFAPGVYQVQTFVRNQDTIPFTLADSIHWKDIIFQEDGNRASVNTTDTLFRQRYRRGYFSYQVDTAKHRLTLKRMPTDTKLIMTMQYQLISPQKIRLQTVLRGDSLSMVIVRTKRHFQLTERQFHWVSEENR